jgi:hypothetical protein
MIKIRSLALVLLVPVVFLFVFWQFMVIESAQAAGTTRKLQHFLGQKEHGVDPVQLAQTVAPGSVRIYIGIVISSLAVAQM